jgi:hypothetical protein
MEEYGNNKENLAPSHEGVQLDVEETRHVIRNSSDAGVVEMEVSQRCALRQHSCKTCSAPSIADLIVLRDRRGQITLQQTLAPRQGFTRLTGTLILASQQVNIVCVRFKHKGIPYRPMMMCKKMQDLERGWPLLKNR